MPSVHASPVSEHAPATTGGRITAPPIVDARWLHANRAAVTIIDVHEASDHAAAHVPGSISLPLDALLRDDTSRPVIEQLAASTREELARLGIDPDSHVALVDDGCGAASLAASILELAGLRRVSAVHGSALDMWRTIGADVDEGVPTAKPSTTSAWVQVASRPGIVAAFEDLVDAVVGDAASVVDARSQLEHEGIVGAPCCVGRGAIPESVHLEWTAFFDIAGDPRPSERVRDIAAHVGLHPDDPIIVACHAGHRAAIAARVLRSAGFRDVRVSLGSWHEWSARGLGIDVAVDAPANA